MRIRHFCLTLPLIPFIFLALPTLASPPSQAVPVELLKSQNFRNHHPDLRWRYEASVQLKYGRGETALEYLKCSARYADKLSQAMIAELLWVGHRVARDRPQAYAWMDLAAERGYPLLLAKREAYWNAMTEAERERAAHVGAAIYADYGDEIAKPRLERMLRLGQTKQVGSRTGAQTQKTFTILEMRPNTNVNFNDGDIASSFTTLYDDFDRHHWVPKLYWELHDKHWRRLPVGEIIVEPLQLDDRGSGGA